MAIEIRRAEARDVPGICEIYNSAIRSLTATFDTEEKSLEDRAAWLAAHTGPHPVFVALDGDTVAGWASLSPYISRIAAARTVESSVYLHPEYCGRGLGTQLMATLMPAARDLGHHAVIALITDGNEASVRLHRNFGYVEIGTLREVGWKFERWLDLLIMEAVL